MSRQSKVLLEADGVICSTTLGTATTQVELGVAILMSDVLRQDLARLERFIRLRDPVRIIVADGEALGMSALEVVREHLVEKRELHVANAETFRLTGERKLAWIEDDRADQLATLIHKLDGWMADAEAARGSKP